MTKGKTKDGLEYLWTDKKRTLFGLPLSFTRYYLTESRLITRIGPVSYTHLVDSHRPKVFAGGRAGLPVRLV